LEGIEVVQRRSIRLVDWVINVKDEILEVTSKQNFTNMKSQEWLEPKAVSIPKENDEWKMGRYGPIWPKTPACYGFTLIANVIPGRAEIIRNHGNIISEAVKGRPHVLAPLKLHYLRWALFDNDTRFLYVGIFDTDFDKYTEDAVAMFSATGITTVF
jgi:hypothetical protein